MNAIVPRLPVENEVVADRYRMLEVLGAGTMGVVMSAERIGLGDVVAIKLMHPRLACDDGSVRRFAGEARTAAFLRSEHVVRVFDSGRLPSGLPYMIMDRLTGRSLQQVLAEDGALRCALAVEYVRQACCGVAEAHAAGFIHRDIKPANVFVLEDRRRPLVKVLDFGLAKRVRPVDPYDDLAMQNEGVVGSPRYMSPEQIATPWNVDARTDVWSLGATLYELVVGRPAICGESVHLLFTAIVGGEIAPLRAHAPFASPELEQVVMCCLRRDRNERFRDAGALEDALARLSRSS